MRDRQNFYKRLWPLGSRTHRLAGVGGLDRLAEHIASLLEAGLPIGQAVSHLRDHPWGRKQSTWLELAATAVDEGRPLSDGWKTFAPQLLTTLLAAGESTGNLASTLRTWTAYVRLRRKTTAKLVRAFSYPVLLTSLMTALLVFVARVVMPMFEGVYSQLGLPVTGVTLLVTHVLTVLPGWVAAALCTAAGLVLSAAVAARLWPAHWQTVAQWLPGVSLHRLSRTHTWSQLLRLHLDAGYALTDTLVQLSTPHTPRWLREASARTLERVLAGEPLARAFAGNWDPLLLVLLRWAEQTGELGAAFGRVETYARDLLQERLRRLVQVLEPVLLMSMGVLVCACMYVVYVPMYDMMTTVSGGQLS